MNVQYRSLPCEMDPSPPFLLLSSMALHCTHHFNTDGCGVARSLFWGIASPASSSGFYGMRRKRRKERDPWMKKREKCEDRVSRTPNLLIWNQTRYHCAMPSLFCGFHSPISVIGVSVGFERNRNKRFHELYDAMNKQNNQRKSGDNQCLIVRERRRWHFLGSLHHPCA